MAVLTDEQVDAAAAELEVGLGDDEAVVRAAQDVQAALGGFGQRRVVEQYAGALPPAAPHATAQLVELGEPEQVGALDPDYVEELRAYLLADDHPRRAKEREAAKEQRGEPREEKEEHDRDVEELLGGDGEVELVERQRRRARPAQPHRAEPLRPQRRRPRRHLAAERGAEPLGPRLVQLDGRAGRLVVRLRPERDCEENRAGRRAQQWAPRGGPAPPCRPDGGSRCGLRSAAGRRLFRSCKCE